MARNPSLADHQQEDVRMRFDRESYYRPSDLANQIFSLLDRMEVDSDTQPDCTRFRKRTGLTCAAEHRGRPSSATELAITKWLTEMLPHAHPKPISVGGYYPDIVLGYERDAIGESIEVFVEAKPIWYRWITDGKRPYSGVVTDEYGRSTGQYASNNRKQLLDDRDKLLSAYTKPTYRHMLLALVFQRPNELDAKIVAEVGAAWQHSKHHVRDLCNPPDDDIGLTALAFWPTAENA